MVRKILLTLTCALGLTGCQLVGVAAEEATQIALEEARTVGHWQVERVGAVRLADTEELADVPDLDPGDDRKIWLVPMIGRFGVACHAGGCDLAGDSLRIFVDPTGRVAWDQ